MHADVAAAGWESLPPRPPHRVRPLVTTHSRSPAKSLHILLDRHAVPPVPTRSSRDAVPACKARPLAAGSGSLQGVPAHFGSAGRAAPPLARRARRGSGRRGGGGGGGGARERGATQPATAPGLLVQLRLRSGGPNLFDTSQQS